MHLADPLSSGLARGLCHHYRATSRLMLTIISVCLKRNRANKTKFGFIENMTFDPTKPVQGSVTRGQVERVVVCSEKCQYLNF